MEKQVIKDPSVAKKLIKDGFKVIDIAPKKEKNKERETVFFFEKTKELEEFLYKNN